VVLPNRLSRGELRYKLLISLKDFPFELTTHTLQPFVEIPALTYLAAVDRELWIFPSAV
jgi:hypothetical protein